MEQSTSARTVSHPGKNDGIARAERDGTRAETNSVFPRNGRVHSNRWGRQFSRLLAAGVCASALVMLDIPPSEVA